MMDYRELEDQVRALNSEVSVLKFALGLAFVLIIVLGLAHFNPA